MLDLVLHNREIQKNVEIKESKELNSSGQMINLTAKYMKNYGTPRLLSMIVRLLKG
jgi:hypothetical protein